MCALVDHKVRRRGMQIAEALNVSQETISRRLRVMGKIIKIGKPVCGLIDPYNYLIWNILLYI